MARIPLPGISRAAFGLALAFVLAACGDDSSSTAPGLSSVPGSMDPGLSSAGGSGDPGSGDPGSGGGNSQSGGDPGTGGSVPAGTSSASGQTSYSYDAGVVIPEPTWTTPACASTGAEVPASDPCVLYYGRWDKTTNPEAPAAAWSATYVKARFNGTGVSVKMTVSDTSTYLKQIDGGAMTRFDVAGTNSTPVQTIQLFTGLPAGDHEIAIYRRSEGGYGMYTVQGLVIENGHVIAPNPPSSRRMECMGNSITAGLGADGDPSTMPQEKLGSNLDNDNTMGAWCVQTALKLGADWQVVAHSGQGMYENLNQYGAFAGQTEYGHIITMYDEYQWTHYPSWSAAPPYNWEYNATNNRLQWNFSSYIPHVAIFAIGTNDYINVSLNSSRNNEAARNQQDADFKAKYMSFLDMVRSHYPKGNTTIFLHGIILGDDGTGVYANHANKTIREVVEARNAAGDDRIFFIDPAGWLNNDRVDYAGDMTHPTSASGHQKIANNVAAIVREKMGW